jgi:dimethylhistidine N-methyltransferase
MSSTSVTSLDSTFAEDVRQGLSHPNKFVPSQYLYDARGDALFQSIMHMDAYYPMNCELEILQTHRQALLEAFGAGGRKFNLIEFGAGDGYKTKVLLRHFEERGAAFSYQPIDISPHVLEVLNQNVREELPTLDIQPLAGEYFEALDSVQEGDFRNVILFMGGNIGNFTFDKAQAFLSSVRERMKPDDLLLCGFDLKKDPHVILRAYNDEEGITQEFNLNLLDRINRELGGHFQRRYFQHFPSYDPVSGACRSFLISTQAQEVPIDGLSLSVSFQAWEAIFTEVSQKYTHAGIEQLAASAGLVWESAFSDQRGYYLNALLRPADA